MLITHRSPSRDLVTLHDQMDRLFDSLFTPAPARAGRGDTRAWAPPADIQETQNEFLVRMDLPGLDPQNVKVSVHESTLSVRGERRESHEKKDASWHRVERFHGIFERQFDLGATVQTDRIEANYRDGVLEIRLPKSEAAKPREIAVQVKQG